MGSLSKSIRAMALMRRVGANKVDRDAEFSRYLNAFSRQRAGTVTIRHPTGLDRAGGHSRVGKGHKRKRCA